MYVYILYIHIYIGCWNDRPSQSDFILLFETGISKSDRLIYKLE